MCSWWQGLNIDVGINMRSKLEPDEDDETIKSPLVGLNVSYHSAQTLADTLDTMRKHHTVRLLNFAYINLDANAMLGQGSFSKVYK